MIWDGCRWAFDRSRQAEQFAKQTVSGLFKEAVAELDLALRVFQNVVRFQWG